ncbi:GTP binding protein [Haplosporangium sp. Z 767]|nr:GTP binding protein [Haplosporangium sp. Z 11]KAF9181039.1 GTP binding protein [Haplosporangium sp. Z 767]
MAAFQLPSSPLEISPWVNHQGSLPPEIDIEGNIEYKLKLIATAPDRFEHLVTQLKWRQVLLSEGHGSAIYEIGVADDGSFVGLSPEDMEISLKTLRRMANFLKADVTILRKVSVESTQQSDSGNGEEASSLGTAHKQLSTHSGSPRTKPEYLVVEAKVTSRLADEHHFLEIRVALVGGPDAGKSTLLGRLAHGIADNGRGKARLNLLRHRHEISTGRTSSISHEIIGFTSKGQIVNYNTTNISSWQEICESSAKVVTLLDTCGHARFLKTTISGLTGHAPDYACLVVDSRVGGVNEMTREHLALTIALGLPMFVVVTKMDMATRDQLRATVTALMALIRTTEPFCLPNVVDEPGSSLPTSQQSSQGKSSTSSGIQKFVPVIAHNEKDLESVVKRFSNADLIEESRSVAIPILLLSSVTGENVHLLERFLYLLPKPSVDNQGGSYSQEPACYQVEEIYNIPDIGTVVGGFLHTGKIQVHRAGGRSQATPPGSPQHRLYLGPVDRDGSFIPVVVKSIHRQRMSMRSIDAGQTATLAIEGPGLGMVKVRRGMVVLESDTDPRGVCCQKFEAVIQVLAHDGFFGVGFQGMIHCGSVHQNAKVMKIEILSNPGQEEDEATVLENDGDLGPADNNPSSMRSASRSSNRESVYNARSSSPSSDYGSGTGTGSSLPGSATMSRSGSIHKDNITNLGAPDDQTSSVSEDQSHQQLRARRRLQRQAIQQHEMIPVSTMRKFKRLSMNHSIPSGLNGSTDTSQALTSISINGSVHVDKGQDQSPYDVQDHIIENEMVEHDETQDQELQAGSRAKVVFRFCHEVVFMREGTTVLFRHGRTKCVGKVLLQFIYNRSNRHIQFTQETMKFFLLMAILAAFAALALAPVNAVFMQFVDIKSMYKYYSNSKSQNTLMTRMLINGQPNEIKGDSSCTHINCANRFCSEDGHICARVRENCRGNATIEIFYANTCRFFELKEGSMCNRTYDGGWSQGVSVEWQDFDFYKGLRCWR